MTIEAVLFDKDGTLIDFDATFAPATQVVLQKLAPNERDLNEIAAAVGFDPAAKRVLPGSVLVAGSLDDIIDRLAAVMDMEDRNAILSRVDHLYQEATLSSLTPFPETESVLEQLHARGIGLGVATNDTEAGAKNHIDALGWTDRFAFVAGCDSGYSSKPAPGMVTAFCDLMGVVPSDTVMVGDSAHDCAAGQTAGAKTIALATPEDIEKWPVQPDAIIRTIGDLPHALEKLRT